MFVRWGPVLVEYEDERELDQRRRSWRVETYPLRIESRQSRYRTKVASCVESRAVCHERATT